MIKEHETNLPPPQISRRLISATELAMLLGVTEGYAKEMDKSRNVPGGVDIGSYRRWDRDVVEKWIDRGCPSLWKVASK